VPFEADSYMGVLTKHMYMTPAPPSDLSPELKSLGALEDVILRCLQKRPAARYDDLAALLADLDQRVPQSIANGERDHRLSGTSLLADQLELPARAEDAPRRGFRYWPALVIALAFVAGVAVVVGLKRARPVAQAPSGQPKAVLAPGPSAAAPPAERGLAAASAGPSVSNSSLPPALTARAPARKPNQIAPHSGASLAPKATGSSSRRRLGAGEIVDPWAR